MMRNFSYLTFFLYVFIQFIQLYLINLDIVTNLFYERMYYQNLERYSFIESYAIQKTIKQFHAYSFDSFIIETSLGEVYVFFIDESAYLHFDFENEVFAQLDYDLVYDSALAYDIIPEALFPSVDKIEH